MSARDALDRLNRNLANGATREPFPDRWPLDHVDIARDGAARRFESLTVPGEDRARTVCDNWPECQCDGDCDDYVTPAPLPGWVWPAWFALLCLSILAAAIVAHWGVR